MCRSTRGPPSPSSTALVGASLGAPRLTRVSQPKRAFDFERPRSLRYSPFVCECAATYRYNFSVRKIEMVYYPPDGMSPTPSHPDHLVCVGNPDHCTMSLVCVYVRHPRVPLNWGLSHSHSHSHSHSPTPSIARRTHVRLRRHSEFYRFLLPRLVLNRGRCVLESKRAH